MDRPEQPDPYLAWRRLAATLEARGRTLVVIVPHIDWQDADIARRFLRFRYDRSTRGVVFFVETKRTDAGRDIDTFFTEKERMGITHLQTSARRPQDWGTYLRYWMEVRDIPAPKIVIHDDVLEYQPETWRPRLGPGRRYAAARDVPSARGRHSARRVPRRFRRRPRGGHRTPHLERRPRRGGARRRPASVREPCSRPSPPPAWANRPPPARGCDTKRTRRARPPRRRTTLAPDGSGRSPDDGWCWG